LKSSVLQPVSQHAYHAQLEELFTMPEVPQNPYQTPVTAEVAEQDTSNKMEAGKKKRVWWRTVLLRWEVMRPFYNAILAATGLISLGSYAFCIFQLQALVFIVLFAIAANLAYFLGPAIDLYIHFLGFRSKWSLGVLFTLGTVFAILVTFAVGAYEGQAFFEQL